MTRTDATASAGLTAVNRVVLHLRTLAVGLDTCDCVTCPSRSQVRALWATTDLLHMVIEDIALGAGREALKAKLDACGVQVDTYEPNDQVLATLLSALYPSPPADSATGFQPRPGPPAGS